MSSNKSNKKLDKSDSIKITYHMGRRYVSVYVKLVASFNAIWKQVVDNSPFNHQTNLEMFWFDEDKDEIIIHDKESFDIYLSYTLGLSPHHLHVRKWNAQRKTKKTANKPYNSVVHDNFECDGCYTSPIVGHMYKCMECPNYDLCQNCMFSSFHMDHDMLQISSSEYKKEASSSSSAPSTSKNSVNTNDSENEESSSSWEDISDVSSDEDNETMNNATSNSCLTSKYQKMLSSLPQVNPRMWWTTKKSSNEDSDNSSRTTVDNSSMKMKIREYYYNALHTTEESSDEDNETMNNATSNSCLTSKYQKMLSSLPQVNPRMWWTTKKSSNEDSNNSSRTTVDNSRIKMRIREYYYNALHTTEESSDEESESESEDNSNCCLTSKYHKTLQFGKDENKISNSSDNSSDGETNDRESVEGNTNCSATNTENIDSDDELNNLVESFVLI